MNKSNINELSAETEADSNSTAQNQHVSQPNANTNVVRSLSYETLGVIIKTKDGKYFQVGLNQEMCNCLFNDLRNYFPNNIVQILPDEITGISMGEVVI